MTIAYLRLHILYLVLSFTFFAFPISLNAQKINLKCAWTNGDESMWPGKLNDTVVYFFAGNFHEGCIEFCLNLNKIESLGFYVGGDSCSDNVKSIRVREINGRQVLFVKSDYRTTMYRQGDPDENFYALMTSIKVNHELAGKYVNPATGKTIIFYPDKQKVTGLTKLSDYVFEEEYDNPTEVISFKNKQSFYYETTEKGLDIFTAKKDDNDEWEKGKKVMGLVKKEWLNTDSLKDTPGKYPFASKEILIEGILSCYTSPQLALMRNEIYARHGMIFKSPTLQKYFSSQSWYKPLSANVTDKLSELEKLNIQSVQVAEEKAKEQEAMRKRDGW